MNIGFTAPGKLKAILSLQILTKIPENPMLVYLTLYFAKYF